MRTSSRLVAAPLARALALSLAACGTMPTEGGVPDPEEAIAEEVEQEVEEIEERVEEALAGEDEAATQRVGTPEFGFVDVPADYVVFHDANGGTDLQYSDASGTSIITLNVFDMESVPEDLRADFTPYDAAQSVASNIDEGGPSSIQGATVELAGRQAYQVYAYFDDGTFLVTWVVDDPAGTIHYVAVEGPESTILDNVELVESTYAFDA